VFEYDPGLRHLARAHSLQRRAARFVDRCVCGFLCVKINVFCAGVTSCGGFLGQWLAAPARTHAVYDPAADTWTNAARCRRPRSPGPGVAEGKNPVIGAASPARRRTDLHECSIIRRPTQGLERGSAAQPLAAFRGPRSIAA